MIPDSLVEEVRARADIVDIIGEHVPLKKAGREYRALCPFHSEKTPSFYVVPAKGFYKCFGCGQSGDLFTFLMERLGLDFPEAVRVVARRVGVDIPETQEHSPEQDRNRPLYEAIAFAEDFYRRQLAGEHGERVRRYLDGRGLDGAAIERFGLGYAPDEWRALIEAAAVHGIAEPVLLEAGLVKESERADAPYDRLRDRLVFPIRDVGDRTIAFGGRVLGPSGPGSPKYLNSPETPIYHKGRLLYGLNWAKTSIRREEVVLVVEGYMDFVSLAARGFENVVAPLGTAMTEEQAALLCRYTKKALLLYDSDAAGLRATFRSADALLRAGVHPLVATLPEGEDPDSLVRREGGKRLRKALDAAVDVIERKIQILEEHGYFDDITGTRRALDRLLPTVRAAIDPALRDLYIDRISRRTGVRRETLEEELKGSAGPTSPGSFGGTGPGRPAVASRPSSAARPETPGSSGQRQLLLLLLRDRARIAAAAKALEPADFTEPVYREIYSALCEAAARESGSSDAASDGGATTLEGQGTESGDGAGDADGSVVVPELVLGDEAAERLKALLADRQELGEGDRMFTNLVNDIRSERLHTRLDELDQLLPLAESRGEGELLLSLVQEKRALAQRLQQMERGVERRVRKRGRGEGERRGGPRR